MDYQRGGRPDLVIVRIFLAQLIRRAEMAHAEHYVLRGVPDSVREVVPDLRISPAQGGCLSPRSPTYRGSPDTCPSTSRMLAARVAHASSRSHSSGRMAATLVSQSKRVVPAGRDVTLRPCAKSSISSPTEVARKAFEHDAMPNNVCEGQKFNHFNCLGGSGRPAHVCSEIVCISVFGFAAPRG